MGEYRKTQSAPGCGMAGAVWEGIGKYKAQLGAVWHVRFGHPGACGMAGAAMAGAVWKKYGGCGIGGYRKTQSAPGCGMGKHKAHLGAVWENTQRTRVRYGGCGMGGYRKTQSAPGCGMAGVVWEDLGGMGKHKAHPGAVWQARVRESIEKIWVRCGACGKGGLNKGLVLRTTIPKTQSDTRTKKLFFSFFLSLQSCENPLIK